MPLTPSTAEPAKPAEPGCGTGVPEGIGRFLTLLHWIIGYGQQLASCLRNGSIGGEFARVVRRYRTRDLAVILARIRRGLLLAAGLQAHLLKRAETGRDLREIPTRWTVAPSRNTGPKRRRASRRAHIVDLPLDRMPSAEEIAIELRRRPPGAVLADICRDLGILPVDLPPDLRDALRDCVMQYGGCLVVLMFKEARDDLRRQIAAMMAPPAPLPALPAPEPVLACPTGPPELALCA